MDTKAKRSAALGYGLSFMLMLPVAEGSISIESAGHALAAYRYDLSDVATINALWLDWTDVALRAATWTETLRGATWTERMEG
jgi:hypothetical protein